MRTEASPPSTCRVGATRGSRGRRIFLSHESPLECDAGNPDPVLSPVPLSTEGDAGCGRDFEGVRTGGVGPSPGPGDHRGYDVEVVGQWISCTDRSVRLPGTERPSR